LIRQVIPQSEADLYRILASLQHKEFLYEQPAFPESEYIFKHALTQEVAYGTVLQEQKKQLHERTGQALEHLHKDTVEEHYGELAHHYQRSANTEKAIEYLQLAGQQAVQRGAYTEAISHLTVALELLLTRPATPERTAQELKLRLALGPPLLAIRGYTAPEAAQQYTRARELCEQLGDLSRRFPALYGLWIFHLNRGELRIAQALAEECLRLAEQMPEAVWLLEAHSAVGATSLWGGEIVRARASLEQATTHYQPQQHPALIALSAQDLRVASFCLMAMALWSLGYPDQALTRMHEALRLSHALGHIFSLAFTLVFTTELHYLRREGQVTQDRAGALVTLSGEYGFSAFLARGTVLWGAALIVREQWTEGITQIQQGLKAYGGELRRTMYLACLAEGYRGAGQVEEGLATIAEALRLVEKNDERYYEAEVWRIKGELALRAGETAKRGNGEEASLPDPKSQILDPEGEAEAYFLKAIDIARQQQAKSLELRAVMSLVRLRQQQPALSESRNTNHASRNTQHATRAKLDEAHQMLSEIYTWFTEGFDTKDLQEAKELLEELH
jgi:predicted ATPase